MGLLSMKITGKQLSALPSLHMTISFVSLNRPSLWSYEWVSLQSCLRAFPVVPTLEVLRGNHNIKLEDFKKLTKKMQIEMPLISPMGPQIANGVLIFIALISWIKTQG